MMKELETIATLFSMIMNEDLSEEQESALKESIRLLIKSNKELRDLLVTLIHPEFSEIFMF